VGVWSDLVSGPVLLETVAALIGRCTVNRTHDIPYIAGSSRDGKTVFIDRHMPASFATRGKRVKTDRFLVLHELVEKSLLDELRLHYLHAHQIALRTEQAAVRAAGISWHDYNAFTQANEKKIGDERLQRVPRTLDLTPYRDEKDFPVLQRLAAAKG
jgi:hypothetical protein